METKIIRIGNSLGTRFSRIYLEKLGLKEGDRITISVTKRHTPNTKRALQALREISRMDGALANADVKAWMDKREAEYSRRDQELRDILGH